MYEVNVKFKPEEWYGGYISKFTTETAYNNAFKLLPNVSKIGNNEIRYIPREEAHLPELYLYVDNINKQGDLFQELRDFYLYGKLIEDSWNSGHSSDMCSWCFQLIGQLAFSNGDVRSLWKLCWKGYDNLDWSDCHYCISQDYNTIGAGIQRDYYLDDNFDDVSTLYQVRLCDKDLHSYIDTSIREIDASNLFDGCIPHVVTCMSSENICS